MPDKLPQHIEVPISAGELIDKLAILEIKVERIADPKSRANVERELDALTRVRDRAVRPTAALGALAADLKAVNAELWQIEDELRDCERRGDFGAGFIALARAVYRTNDRRAALKREINMLLGSALVEEKSYTRY
jgi:hypothetical protein